MSVKGKGKGEGEVGLEGNVAEEEAYREGTRSKKKGKPKSALKARRGFKKRKISIRQCQCFIAVPEEENQGRVISEDNSVVWERGETTELA